MVLAMFLFMRRMAEATNVSAVALEIESEQGDAGAAELRRDLAPGIAIYEINSNSPFFFGAAEKFRETLGRIAKPPKVLVLRMANVTTIDSTALNAMKDLVHRTRKDGTLVVLSELEPQPRAALGRSHVLDEIGEEHIRDSIEEALMVAREYVEASTILDGVAGA
ncbi:MAG: STAS domain-containing protein [Longimicrobiales bacterium]